MILIDGAKGEGGGQVLRTALSLSACTGQPFRIKNIRAGRKKPGLMRQHLTCVEAAEAVCGGKTQGATLGSTEVTFTPGDPRGGEYIFDVGTAGATTLVFQTVLPILLAADEPSRVTLRGGTHTMSAPSFDFLVESFLPLLARMGAVIDTALLRPGFYPAGGGEWSAAIEPLAAPVALDVTRREAAGPISAEALRANLSAGICKRELAQIASDLDLPQTVLRQTSHDGPGPGNAVLVRVPNITHTEVFSQIGRFGVKAETVAARAASETRHYLASDAAISDHLADQLLLPLALLDGGRFTTAILSRHFSTNVETISLFLDVDVRTEAMENGWLVEAGRKTGRRTTA